MSKSAWSGNPPKDESEARARLCEATLSCIVRMGLTKTSMSDIAKEAGVTRPTLYKHFNSKTAAFIAAIDAVSFEFAHAVAKHVSRLATIEERIIEMILFVVKELPRHNTSPWYSIQNVPSYWRIGPSRKSAPVSCLASPLPPS